MFITTYFMWLLTTTILRQTNDGLDIRSEFIEVSEVPPKIACINHCRVAVVEFVRLFIQMISQMHPQTACQNRRIVTLVTLLRLVRCHHCVFSNGQPNCLHLRLHKCKRCICSAFVQFEFSCVWHVYV